VRDLGSAVDGKIFSDYTMRVLVLLLLVDRSSNNDHRVPRDVESGATCTKNGESLNGLAN
jgi:hypothetical protein